MEVTRDIITKLYIHDRLSIKALSEKLGKSEESTRRLLIAFGVPRRHKAHRLGGWNKGGKLPKKQRDKMSATRKERIQNGKITHWATGRPCPLQTRTKISAALLNGRDAAPSYYGADWKLQRTSCLQRDGFTCQQCGATDGLEVHHWEPYRFSFNNSLENLVTLCAECHRITHETYRREGFVADAEAEGVLND